MILKNIFMYLAFINILAFACFGIDKQKAKTHQWRISEKTLLGIAICGGCVGAILGWRSFPHKTQHAKFALGLPAILILQGIAAILIYSLV